MGTHCQIGGNISLWDDRKEILAMIQHIFERYAGLPKPLPTMHKDTLRRLALAWAKLMGFDTPR